MINYSLGQQIKKQSPYEQAFASIGAILLESRMDCWGKIQLRSTDNELDHALCEILSYLDLPIHKERFVHQRNQEEISVSYNIEQENEQYYLKIQKKTGTDKGNFLMTSLSTIGDQKQKSQEKVLGKHLKLETYYCYTGNVPERTTALGREKLLNTVWKNMQANPVDHYRDAYLESGTAYSQELEHAGEVLLVGGEKVNLQAAIKCSAKDENTTIYLSIPLLLNDY